MPDRDEKFYVMNNEYWAAWRVRHREGMDRYWAARRAEKERMASEQSVIAGATAPEDKDG